MFRYIYIYMFEVESAQMWQKGGEFTFGKERGIILSLMMILLIMIIIYLCIYIYIYTHVYLYIYI